MKLDLVVGPSGGPEHFPSTDWWMIWRMASTQSNELVVDLLNRLLGETVADLQVMGVNSLKSVTPSLSDLVGLADTRRTWPSSSR